MLLQRTGLMPLYRTVAYTIMQFCRFWCMYSFVSGPLFQFAFLQQAYKTARQEGRPSPPRCCRHLPRPGGSAPVLASGAGRGQLQVGRGGGSIGGRLLRRDRSGSSAPNFAARAGSGRKVGGGSGGGGGRSRPSPLEAPAAAISRALSGAAIVDVFSPRPSAQDSERRPLQSRIAGAQNSEVLKILRRPEPLRYLIMIHYTCERVREQSTAEIIRDNKKGRRIKSAEREDKRLGRRRAVEKVGCILSEKDKVWARETENENEGKVESGTGPGREGWSCRWKRLP